MGGIHPGKYFIHPLVRPLDGQLVAAAGRNRHLRPLYHALFLQVRLAAQRRDVQEKQELQSRLRMDECDHFRHRRSVAGTHLLLSDVRDSLVVDGEIAAGRGLSLRQQGSLRSPDAQYPGGISVRTPYDAFFENQKIVLRKRQMALSPPQGTGPNRAQRRSGIQLSGRRYGAARAAGCFVLRRAAAVPANFRTSGRPRTADAGIHGHHAPGGQA